MRNKLIISITVIILTFFLIISVFNNEVFFEKEVELASEKKTCIQDLIDRASDKDVIYLSNAIHYEHITIDKHLTIKGENKDSTILDGNGQGTVVTIESGYVKLENITIRNSGGYSGNSAIKIKSDECQIKNCIIFNTRTGINLHKSKNNIISNCFFHTNSEGVYCNCSQGNLIKYCQFRNNAFGIHLNRCNSEEIKNSYLHINGVGIYDKKSTNTKIYDCAICDNNQDGGGIWSYGSVNLLVKNSNINHNGAGVRLQGSKADISSCNLFYNMYNTFRILDVEECSIFNCDIKNCFRTAIFIRGSSCNINNNNIINSGLYGIDVGKSSFCNAENNYWGSKIGPSFNSFGAGDRISFRPLKIKIFPWSGESFENIGSKWFVEDVFEKTEIKIDSFCNINFSEKDTDKDGVPDWWEKKYGYDPYTWNDHLNLDPDNDALNNIQECYTDDYGSNPFYKDIFIEVDFSDGNKPTNEYIKRAKEIFKEHDIALHIDVGELGGSQKLSFSSIDSAAKFRDIYWDCFLDNDLDNPRRGIFRYTVVVDTIEELYGGFVFVGFDNLDTIGLATKGSRENYWYVNDDKIVVGGIIHELGHTMGLLIDDHGGIDNLGCTNFFTRDGWQYKNYFSCLNYRYVFLMLGFSDGTHGQGDFDDWSNLDFGFFKNTNFDLLKY